MTKREIFNLVYGVFSLVITVLMAFVYAGMLSSVSSLYADIGALDRLPLLTTILLNLGVLPITIVFLPFSLFFILRGLSMFEHYKRLDKPLAITSLLLFVFIFCCILFSVYLPIYQIAELI